jgi:hypothetical protein
MKKRIAASVFSVMIMCSLVNTDLSAKITSGNYALAGGVAFLVSVGSGLGSYTLLERNVDLLQEKIKTASPEELKIFLEELAIAKNG